MTVATFAQPDRTVDNGTVYTTKIDAAFKVVAEVAQDYAVHELATPNMTVLIDAGKMWDGKTLTSNTQQTSATIVAPTTNPRIDRVVIDSITGVASVITGVQAASPSAPAITIGKIPIAQILLQTTSTTITDSMITDERVGYSCLLGGGYVSGSVGVGVAPSAWGTDFKAYQVNSATLMGRSGAIPVGAWLTSNCYYDGANWRAIATGGSSIITLYDNGAMGYENAASVAAGAVATPVQRWATDSSGKFTVGTVPLARMGTVALSGSISLANTVTSNQILSANESTHEFFNFSVHTNGAASVAMSYMPAGSHAKIVVNTTDATLSIENASGATNTFYYKAYKLTET